MGMTIAMADTEAIRGYFLGLRNAKKWSQARAAKEAGVPSRTYQSWENGATQDIKTAQVVKVITALGGAVEHLDILRTFTTVQQGQELAKEWIKTPEGKRQAQRIEAKAFRIIELNEHDPANLERVIEALRQDARADPAILDAVMNFLAGRRSR